MKQNEKIVFASSIFEEKPEKKAHKSATVKKGTASVEKYHETYY